MTFAAAFSEKLGVAVREPGDSRGLVIATGHQPEFYHAGVWIKDFLMQRLSDETSAMALDIVVDSDGFEALGVAAPCLTPTVHHCWHYLAAGGAESCFACTAVPQPIEIAEFCAATDNMLAALPSPEIRQHFAVFCTALAESVANAENLGELVTIARRRFEGPTGTDYLELPVTRMVRSSAFAAFVADLALSADRFAEAYNAELAEYRTANKTRSALQPFPDLVRENERTELPLWLIHDASRSTVWAQPLTDGGVRLVDDHGDLVAELPRDGDGAIHALEASGALVAPKALALTLFARMFVCDLFIHGVGGGRYDRVTDGVCRRYYGVDAPAFVVASITMYLPLGVPIVTEDEVSSAKERLNRLEHNPDALLGEVQFDSAEEASRALSLAKEKSRLVSAIAAPGADKKSLGMRIREVNGELSALLAPLRTKMQAELEALEVQLSASEVFTDRTYPFCFWAPQEVADKAR
jgi:hypothetical protein